MHTKSQHLRKNSDFTTIYSKGKRHYFSGVLLFFIPNNKNYFRYACIVGKKHSPLATKRNRQRRILRHALHAYIPQIKPGFDIVLSYTNHHNVLTYKEAHAIIGKLLHVAKLFI